MRSIVFLGWMIIILCASCTQENEQSNSFCDEKVWYNSLAVSENEDQVMMRLSTELIPNPELQAHKDHNGIIAFAIDHGLDLQMTRSGLFYVILDKGKNPRLDWGDQIAVQYRGYFLNEQIFDSSCQKGDPLEFYIGNMIDAWNEGLQLVGVGGRILLLSPSRLAYGEEGLTSRSGQELVPPDEVLVFEVEVVRKLG